MTRRYVQAPSAPPKQPRVKRPSNTLTAAELQSLPTFLNIPAIPVKPPVQVKPKRTYEPIDDEFIAKRSPGSKTIKYRRHPKQPIYSLYDRLNRTTVTARQDGRFSHDDHTYNITVWTCLKYKPFKDPNLHLIDYNAPVEEPETYNILHITLTSPTTSTHLLETPAGRVCPNCKSNEFIKSDLKNMPISYQNAHWRDRESFGEHCQVCRCSSK